MCICFSILLPSKAFPHLNILSNCRLPCCDIYIYISIYTYSSVHARLHIQCVPLTFLEKFVAAASHVFMFLFFNAHLWDLGTPKMDGKMGNVLLHITGSEAWLKLRTRNVHAIELQNFSPSPSRVLWGKHCL